MVTVRVMDGGDATSAIVCTRLALVGERDPDVSAEGTDVDQSLPKLTGIDGPPARGAIEARRRH